MAKKQTRRTVSINRALFDEAKAHAGDAGVSLSQLCEDALIAMLRPHVPTVKLLAIESKLRRLQPIAKAA